MDQSISGADALALLLPIVVPYVTAAIKRLWAAMMGRVPKWLGPFKAVVAGWMVAGVSRAVGVPLPTDLTQITDDTTTAILMSGVLIGAVGAWIRDLFDSLKKRFDEDSAIGKLVRLVSGRGELLGERGEVTVAAIGVVLLFSVVVSAMLRVHAQEAIERSRCEVEAASRLAPTMPTEELAARQQQCWERFGVYLPWPH